jgi:hypothetical protein
MHPMDENLVGYLLDALDDETKHEVETYLRGSAGGRARLERLRALLAPLESDRDEETPPRGLVEQTLARVAGPARTLPFAPQLPRSQAQSRSWWRPSEMLVASLLALVVLGLAGAWIHESWRQSGIRRCQENLRALHGALMQYADQREGALPVVEAEGSRAFAAVFGPVLAEARVLPQQASVSCPASEPCPSLEADQLRRMDEWYTAAHDRFTQARKELASSYAYTLGYREGRDLKGLRRTPQTDDVPILADRPPFTSQNPVLNRNSWDHGGRGQNVLFISGTVKFITTRAVGVRGDDIYLNDHRQILAGVHPADCVLAPGDAAP